jgi:M6 family metalloprotease-like protein
MMNHRYRWLVVTLVLLAGLMMPFIILAESGLWLQFAHPASPHMYLTGPDMPMSIPALFDSPTAVVKLPVLVVLMQFTDVTSETVHSVAFFEDMIFGDSGNPNRPSVAEIYEEISNGRLLLEPATLGDQDGAQDGIVGWRTAQNLQACRMPTSPGTWECRPDLTTQAQCTNQGFEWGSFVYWWCDIHGKRAEGIRVADPVFNYAFYDNNPADGIIANNELLIFVVNADDTVCDQHAGHPSLPGCTQQAGGNVRITNPRQVPVEGGTLQVYQHVAALAEQANVSVFAHEVGHSVLGLEDLYQISGSVNDATGYTVGTDWYPPPPERYSLMSGYPWDRINHLDPWAKIHLGFVRPQVASHDGTYTLHDAETVRSFAIQASQPEALMIYDPLRANPFQEYFILENRGQANLEDQGLAVWLIDENEIIPGGANNLRRALRLLRRDGPWAALNTALWDGATAAEGYDLTATSTPRNTNWTDGSPSYVEIYDISPAGPAMTFKVRMPPIFVDRSHAGPEDGSRDKPFNTISEGISAIPEPPRTLRIAGGSYAGGLLLDSPCSLMGWRDGDAVIGE